MIIKNLIPDLKSKMRIASRKLIKIRRSGRGWWGGGSHEKKGSFRHSKTGGISPGKKQAKSWKMTHL